MRPESIQDLQEIVCEHSRVQPHGGKSKTALSASREGALQLDLTGLAGLLEYQPAEFTFTALAGTRLAEVEQALAQHGQYLPFDPPFGGRGATLGGTVAAGLSGAGRYRSGGVRDFILGVRYVDAQGQVVRGGGKVVKNAAGFDLPKLMVGSLGRFGVLVELSFKVFPRPAATATVRVNFSGLSPALETLVKLTRAPLDLQALELLPEAAPGNLTPATALLARIGGKPDSFPVRLERLQSLLGGGEALNGPDEAALWQAAGEFAWLPEGWRLVKVPLTPARLVEFDARLAQAGALRRYSSGAALAWVGWHKELSELEALLNACELSGLVVLGPAEKARLGLQPGAAFERRVKQALDPAGKFE